MRKADLNPPLGKPGGPCHLMERIRDQVSDPHLEDRLITEVEHGKDLSNEEAAKVYPLEVEPGVGVIRQFFIGPHAAYRMDLRSITVADVREALKSFVKEFSDAKSRRDAKYAEWSRTLQRGEKIEYLSPKKLLVVFKAPRPDQVKIITTFWKGRPDPKPHPGQCMINAGFRNYESVGQTRRQPALNGDRTKQQVLPSPEHSRTGPSSAPSYNVPPAAGGGGGGSGERSVVDKARTTPSKGEDSPKPSDISDSTVFKRRHDAAINGPPFPGSNRQREQKGLARSYHKRYYVRNRSKIKRRMQKWLTRHKHQHKYKRDRERRRDFPEKFKRKPGGGYLSVADRSKEYRERKKREKSATCEIEFLHIPTDQYGIIHDVDEDGIVFLSLEGVPYEATLDALLRDIVLLEDEDVERLFVLLDQLMGFEESRVAEMVRREPPDMPPDQKIDRASPRQDDTPKMPTPGGWPEVPVHDNPGSAKVIPDNKDFVNHKAHGVRVAVRISEIVKGCSSELQRKAEKVPHKLKRVDPKNHMWSFDVKGKSGTHTVRIKAIPKGNTTAVAKMDVLVACSCPFWQWQGPEHWAKAGGYLYGKARGTASRPVVKDPDGEHRACHHVLSVLAGVARTEIAPRNRGVRKLASLLWAESVERVARRYLQASQSPRK